MSSQAEPNHPIDGVPTEYELDLAEDKLHEECGVFGVYGQVGCTSPRRIVLLGGTPAEALQLREHRERIQRERIAMIPDPSSTTR